MIDFIKKLKKGRKNERHFCYGNVKKLLQQYPHATIDTTKKTFYLVQIEDEFIEDFRNFYKKNVIIGRVKKERYEN